MPVGLASARAPRTATPPLRRAGVMNSRRFMLDMGVSHPVRWGLPRPQSSTRQNPHVLWAILNRSERAGTRLRKLPRQPPPLCETLFKRPVPGAGPARVDIAARSFSRSTMYCRRLYSRSTMYCRRLYKARRLFSNARSIGSAGIRRATLFIPGCDHLALPSETVHAIGNEPISFG
jgi:hypothetical protein